MSTDSSMHQDSYTYYINFILPNHQKFYTEDEEIVIDELGITLQPFIKKKFSEANEVILFGPEFADKRKTFSEALKVNTCLRLASLYFSIGIISPQKTEAECEKHNNKALYDRVSSSGKFGNVAFYTLDRGINILTVPEWAKTKAFPSLRGELNIGKTPDDFIKEFKNIYINTEKLNISEVQNIAIDILNSSFHETSLWSGFLLCISAIELLCPAEKEEQDILNAIKEISNFIDKEYTNIEINKKLKNKMNRFDEKSIGKRCRDNIRKYLGKHRSSEFTELYNTRSEIAHGTFHFTKKYPDHQKAFDLARDLLFSQVGISFNQ